MHSIKNSGLLIALIATLALSVTGSAQAASAQNSSYTTAYSSAYVGVLLGVGISGSHVLLEPGLEGGYRFQPEFSVGIYGQEFSSSADVGSVSASSHTWLYGVAGDYYFPQVQGLHAGLKIGLQSEVDTSTSTGTGTVSGTTTNFTFAPEVGYDHPLSSEFSIGGQVDLFLPIANGTVAIFNLLASAKYHF